MPTDRDRCHRPSVLHQVSLTKLPVFDVGRCGGVGTGENRADADSDPRLAVAEIVRLADRLDDPFAQAPDVGLAARARLDDGELVAADACDRVAVAKQAAQTIRDHPDHLVAGSVAQSVVDLLEAIEIEHQQGDLLAGAAVSAQRLRQPVLEQGAVGKAGELVVERGGVAAGMDVLDVACGTGNATIPAARAGARVTGVDFAPRLLEIARERSADAMVEIDFVEGDVQELPFEDRSYDRVV